MTKTQSISRSQLLATEKTEKLIFKFAIPSIISGLVSALYNIVDQIFIGQSIGIVGNAATNVAFPLSILCTSLALLLGVGGAANFNLCLGAGNKEEAGKFAANSVSLMGIIGIILAILVNLFLNPLMIAFGASGEVLPYALTYTGITSLGIPFLIFSIGCSNIIRADGSPTYSMLCTLVGALLNTILDPIFMFGLDMGIAGAALATVISQIISSIMALAYLLRFKTVPLKPIYFKPKAHIGLKITTLGASPCFNQLAMMLVQIIMNNTLTYYGSLSPYGSDIPLACVGVISKVNIIYMAFVLGIAQGCQPIMGFNYGAKNYKRVKRACLQALGAVCVVSLIAFASFQLFPRQIISLFGQGEELYFHFAERYFRIFMFFTFLNGLQPMSSFFFTSIGKAQKGIVLSLTRQIVFLIPLILILPRIMGIDGVMYAGPVADGAAALLATFLLTRQFKTLDKLQLQKETAIS